MVIKIKLFDVAGFVISFGMRCNMGMAKLKFEHKVRTDYKIWDKFSICWVYLDLSKRFLEPKVLILGTWGCLMGCLHASM